MAHHYLQQASTVCVIEISVRPGVIIINCIILVNMFTFIKYSIRLLMFLTLSHWPKKSWAIYWRSWLIILYIISTYLNHLILAGLKPPKKKTSLFGDEAIAPSQTRSRRSWTAYARRANSSRNSILSQASAWKQQWCWLSQETNSATLG